MSRRQTHAVATSDDVTMAGTVLGNGPPLVLVHGALGDGDIDWQELVGHLSARFTCHLPSLRGRGLSGDHHDLSLGRRIDDVVAYIDSIGEPTGLVGWSAGGASALVAASRCDAVTAVAVYEPVLDALMNEQERADIGQALAEMEECAADGDLPGAARAFGAFVLRDDELAAFESAGYFEATGCYAPNLLNTFRQAASAGSDAPAPPSAADPAVLSAISVPVLVLYGSNSKPFWARFARHVAEHVPNSRMHEVRGPGHGGPLTQAASIAEPVAEFLAGYSALRHGDRG